MYLPCEEGARSGREALGLGSVHGVRGGAGDDEADRAAEAEGEDDAAGGRGGQLGVDDLQVLREAVEDAACHETAGYDGGGDDDDDDDGGRRGDGSRRRMRPVSVVSKKAIGAPVRRVCREV